MARLYSEDISFDNQQDPALFSILKEGRDLFCIVRYMDKRLPYMQSGDTLVINSLRGVKEPHNLPSTFVEALKQLYVSCVPAVFT